MECILMNKNTPVADISVTAGKITAVNDVFAPEHLPVGIRNDDRIVSDMDKWFSSRSIPASRDNIREGLDILSSACNYEIDTLYLSEKCFGLSLSDQYWLNPADSPVNWGDINFFEHSFSEDIGKILFDGIEIHNPDLLSPDNTSDGNIKKKWAIVDGNRCLIKGGTLPFYQEPFNEKIANLVCKALGISEFVEYKLAFQNDSPVSICKNFIDTDTELVTAYALFNTQSKDNNTSEYERYVNICKACGIDDIECRLDEMMVLDYVIGNTDRHKRNFGLIRNVNTLEYIGIAPLFDSGTSLLCSSATENIFSELGRCEYKLRSKAFRSTQYEQIKLVKSPERFEIDKLRSITNNIADVLSTGGMLSPARIDGLISFYNSRIKSLDEIFARKKSAISLTCKVNEVTDWAERVSEACEEHREKAAEEHSERPSGVRE